MASASLLGLVSALTFPAMAQATETEAPIVVSQATDTGPQSPDEEKATQETNTTAGGQAGEEEVVVVGSRIRRDTYSSPSPIQVITREDSVMAGYSSAADVLQGTATTGGSSQINNAYGGYVTDGGGGANTLSLRGLGPSRTLVLINGRRVAPAGTRGAVGSADLNVLPNAMIERIEILRDGASSIYGSDAISGVVNVITKKNVEGVTVEGQYNRPQDGGGEQGRFSIVAGGAGDGWQLSGSAEYYEQTQLRYGDRDWTSCWTDNFRDPDTGESLDDIDPLTGRPKCFPLTGTGSGGVTINTIGTNTRTGVAAAGAFGTRFNRFRPNSGITSGPDGFLAGYEGVGGGGNSLNVRDTFEDRMLNQSLVSGSKIATAFVQGSYELHSMGDAEIYAEVLVNNRKSEQIGYRQLALDYVVGSPLIPEGLTDSDLGGGSATTGSDNIGVRAFIGFGNDRSTQDVTYYKANGGLRGELGFGDWRYDLNISYAKSDATYTFDSFLTDKLYYATHVVPGPGGALTCAINLVNPSENCVAAPPLSSQVVGGVLPENFRNYIFRPVTGTTTYDETIFSATVDGSLFALWYGDVAAAFGVEYRTSEIDDTPSIDSQNGNLLNFTSGLPTRGDDSVFEAFGEIEVPLLKDLAFADSLTVNVSGRYTDYDSYGSDWTYKVGGQYAPVKWFSVRATYGTSYRAPALFEQFQGATTGFLDQDNDPCNEYGTSPDTTLRTNCASEGLAPDFRAVNGITVVSAGGAANGLAAETSDNLTVGAIFQTEIPDGWGDLAVAVDYYDIEIDNGVAQVGAGDILTRCYEDPDFRSGGGLCNLIDPRASNGALTVQQGYTNISTQTVEGIDFNIRYQVDVGPGTLLVNAYVTQYLEQGFKTFPDDELEDYNGTIGQPDYAGDLDVSYDYMGFRLRYGLEWVSSTDSYDLLEEDAQTSIFDFDTENYFLHNVSLRYENEEAKWSAVVGVRNIADEVPPSISSLAYNRVGNAPLYSGYDYVGREFFVNLTASF